jgi:hypothetical protein
MLLVFQSNKFKKNVIICSVMSFRQVCTIIEDIFVVKKKIKTIHRDMNALFATLQCIDGCFRVYDTMGSFSTRL